MSEQPKPAELNDSPLEPEKSPQVFELRPEERQKILNIVKRQLSYINHLKGMKMLEAREKLKEITDQLESNHNSEDDNARQYELFHIIIGSSESNTLFSGKPTTKFDFPGKDSIAVQIDKLYKECGGQELKEAA